jgi:hypothetical protein
MRDPIRKRPIRVRDHEKVRPGVRLRVDHSDHMLDGAAIVNKLQHDRVSGSYFALDVLERRERHVRALRMADVV